MSRHYENELTIHFAGQHVDDAQDFAADQDWDDDTTYRFLVQLSLYAGVAADQYRPEAERRYHD